MIVTSEAEYSRNYVRVLLAPPRAARPPPGLAPCGMACPRSHLKNFGVVFTKICPRREMKLTAALIPDAPARPVSITRERRPDLRIARLCGHQHAPRAEAEFLSWLRSQAALNPDAPARSGGITCGLGPDWRPAHRCGQRSAPGAGAEFPKRMSAPYPSRTEVRRNVPQTL